MRKSLVETATGRVINVIEIELDAEGTHDHWHCPDGCEIRDAEDSGPGWSWDGATFIPPVIAGPTRLDVLMSEEVATQVYDEETETMVDRPAEDIAEDIAADKSELLGLLHSKLADTGDLTWEEMNKMLALERES